MPCQYIYIYKGDDTNWNNEQFVTINVTTAEGSSIDLSAMKAKFILGSYSNEYDLTTGSFSVDLTAATTDVYAYGPINGIVRVYDTQNRVKTITNTIPFYVTDKVIAEQHQSIDLDVPQGSSVDINVTVGGQVSYNDLADKPSINGVTVEGAKSGYDYGLADEAGLALKVSKSGDTMTGNLVLSAGVGIETPNAKIKEVNNKLVLGNKSNNYGLYVNPNGTGAAFVSAQGNADVLKSTDLRNTYDPNSTYPITGQGVSSAISGKQDTITGAATTITASNLSSNKTLISDNNGKVAASTVTATELGYVSGVTSAIQTQINNEVSARTNADNDLQGQIDAISAASDVTDIVGTYAELQAYDTQHLKDNDIIKVLTDSTHDNASTYYRWSTHTQTFTYIGSEGPYYTKAEADAEFLSQENAATTYLTQANAASTYETQANATASLALKASNADGTTIVDNGTNISTVAVKEQRANTAIKQWVGTKAQYEAITTKDANTVYVITDETDVEAITVDSALSSTSIHPVQNKAIYTALQGKQDTLPAGTTGYFLQKTAGGVQWAQVQAGGVPTIKVYKGNTGSSLITTQSLASAQLIKVYKNGILLEENGEVQPPIFIATAGTQYVTLNNIPALESANNWEIDFTMKMGTKFNTWQTLWVMRPNTNETYYTGYSGQQQFVHLRDTGYLQYAIHSNWPITSADSYTQFAPTSGQIYDYKVSFTGSAYQLNYKLHSDENYTQANSFSSTSKLSSAAQVFMLYPMHELYTEFFKIKMDGVTVLDGSTMNSSNYTNNGCEVSEETGINDYSVDTSTDTITFTTPLTLSDKITVEVF